MTELLLFNSSTFTCPLPHFSRVKIHISLPWTSAYGWDIWIQVWTISHVHTTRMRISFLDQVVLFSIRHIWWWGLRHAFSQIVPNNRYLLKQRVLVKAFLNHQSELNWDRFIVCRIWNCNQNYVCHGLSKVGVAPCREPLWNLALPLYIWEAVHIK